MAYSDYGSYVYQNGVRRTDKEDVGVFDTDESVLPSGARIWANIMKNRANGDTEWYKHSHHGVMGDGQIRVACYKQGFPGIWHWKEGEDHPVCLDSGEIVTRLSLQGKSYVENYKSNKTGRTEYYIDYEYPIIVFEYEGYKFSFESSNTSGSGHYEASMTEPDGTEWECVYDYGFGAGFSDE